MEDTLAKQSKSCLSVHLPLDEFELRHMALDHAIIDRPG